MSEGVGLFLGAHGIFLGLLFFRSLVGRFTGV